MSAVVVYESMFGNTQAIAEAIAAGVATAMPVEVLEVGDAPDTLSDQVVLLVVGGPTHAFGMTRERTRADAAQEAERAVVSRGRGMREWLQALDAPASPVPAATFDTRTDRPRVPGSAARAADKRLRKLGFQRAAPPETFWVHGVEGPLADGEVDRARRWGEQLARFTHAERAG